MHAELRIPTTLDTRRMLCRLLPEDGGPLGAARRLREAYANPQLISVRPQGGRDVSLNMALRCYQEALRSAPSAAIAYEQVRQAEHSSHSPANDALLCLVAGDARF